MLNNVISAIVVTMVVLLLVLLLVLLIVHRVVHRVGHRVGHLLLHPLLHRLVDNVNGLNTRGVGRDTAKVRWARIQGGFREEERKILRVHLLRSCAFAARGCGAWLNRIVGALGRDSIKVRTGLGRQGGFGDKERIKIRIIIPGLNLLRSHAIAARDCGLWLMRIGSAADHVLSLTTGSGRAVDRLCRNLIAYLRSCRLSAISGQAAYLSGIDVGNAGGGAVQRNLTTATNASTDADIASLTLSSTTGFDWNEREARARGRNARCTIDATGASIGKFALVHCRTGVTFWVSGAVACVLGRIASHSLIDRCSYDCRIGRCGGCSLVCMESPMFIY